MERRLTAILAADAVGDSDFDPPRERFRYQKILELIG